MKIEVNISTWRNQGPRPWVRGPGACPGFAAAGLRGLPGPRTLLLGVGLSVLVACRSSAGPAVASLPAPGADVGSPAGPPAPAAAREPDPSDYASLALEVLAGDGLRAARVEVVEGPSWRTAADGASTLGEALARAGIRGVRVEPRGSGFCARSAASTDCAFVTVRGPGGTSPRVADLDPGEVEAVVFMEPAPPDGDARMAWREELRTGRLVLFVGRGSFSG